MTLLPNFLILPDNGNGSITTTLKWRQPLSVGCPLKNVDTAAFEVLGTRIQASTNGPHCLGNENH